MRTFFLLMVAFCLSLHVYGQANPVKIVFDVSSADVEVHESTIRHVEIMSKAYPESEFEIVVYGGSIDMVLTETSSVSDKVEMLAAKDNVTFVICEFTMKRKNVASTHLISGVKIVPDGILELAQKQQEGWAYIKESN